MNLLYDPWPWYVSGPLIALMMALLLFLGRRFGLSSNLKTLCSLAGAGRCSDYFAENWRAQSWNLLFALGALLGGALTALAGARDRLVAVSPRTAEHLRGLGIGADDGFVPRALFGAEAFASPVAWLLWIAGGFLIGFGTRWARGCTSGHGISGLSALQIGSLYAVLGFFAGGLIAVHLLLPRILA